MTDLLFAFVWILGVTVGVPLAVCAIATQRRVSYHYHYHAAPQQQAQLLPSVQEPRRLCAPPAVRVLSVEQSHRMALPQRSTAVTRR